jgi:hypothetical protein
MSSTTSEKVPVSQFFPVRFVDGVDGGKQRAKLLDRGRNTTSIQIGHTFFNTRGKGAETEQRRYYFHRSSVMPANEV